MRNLALKGIEAVLKAADEDAKARFFDEEDDALLVEIEKRLPVAAGIAGGSGNGAAAMLGLNALMGYPFSLRELMSIGARIGADVPFSIFMNSYRNRAVLMEMRGIEETRDAAWTSGIGDIVEPADPLERYVIMANPGISVSTKEAYKAIDEIGYDDSNPDAFRDLFVNDLESFTLENYPEAARLKAMMEEKLSADEILMSGSGPTIAAYYVDKDAAEREESLLKELISGSDKAAVWLTSTGITQEGGV